MASPCSNDPNEVLEKIVSIKNNADKFDTFVNGASTQSVQLGTGSPTPTIRNAAGIILGGVDNANKLDRFVNGTATQTVQLGSGSPTPTIRNAVRQIKADGEWIKRFIADAPEGDVSLNNVTALGSTTSRTLMERHADIINVKDFGAKGDGVTDDTNAFSAAAQARQRLAVYGRAAESTWPFPKMAQVYVPSGVYLISETVDTGNAEVWWFVDATAKINGIEHLGGTVVRNFNLSMPQPSGTRDNACTMAITNGVPEVGKSAGICGYQAPSGLGTYPYADSCGLYIGSTSPAIVAEVDNVTYSSTSVTLGTALSAEQMKRLKKGMLIHTKHTEVGKAINNSRYCGVIDSWNSNGTVIYVKDGWYKKPETGTDTTAKTPPNGAGIVINSFDHVFGQNTVVHLGYNSTDLTTTGKTTKTQSTIGYELDVYNHQDNSSDEVFDLSNAALGFYAGAVSEASGTYKCQSAFSAWGAWRNGFSVQSNNLIDRGFNFRSQSTGGIGFASRGAAMHFQGKDIYDNLVFSVGTYGDIGIGKRSGEAHNPAIYFYSSAGNSWDSAITTNGGTGVNASGEISFQAVGLKTAGHIYPNTDNILSLGRGDNRWAVVYAGSSSINTSDERLKQQISSFTDEEMLAWGQVEFKKFLFNNAVEKKGSSARVHSGLIAQHIAEVFERHNLDPTRYAFFCYDEWEDEYEDIIEKQTVTLPNPLYGKYENQPETITDEVESVVGRRLVKAAGNQYSLRYEECLCWECAYQRWLGEKRDARIAELETRLNEISGNGSAPSGASPDNL